MPTKTKLETWQADLDTLNTERSTLIYRLMDEAGHDPGDWAGLASVQASDHPDLQQINAAIAEHVAQRPDSEGER